MKYRKLIAVLFRWFFIAVITILLAIGFRVFLFETYVIPTPSMEPSSMAGDHVVVGKLAPGPSRRRSFL